MRVSTSHARLRSGPRSRWPSQEHTRRVTLVWIDAREAIVASWSGDAADLMRLESDVPPRHRSTGRVRHRPEVRHGGGGLSQSALERHRQEHLARFIELVARRLPNDEDVVILGPGHVRDRLARQLASSDIRHRRERTVCVEPATRLSERQLIARLLALQGETPPRQKVGGYP